MIKKNYVTVTGTKFHQPKNKLHISDSVILLKDHNNNYDDEAIAVFSNEREQIGFVANSTRTVARGTFSAGRLYDKFDHYAVGIVRFILKDDMIVEVFYEENTFPMMDDLQLDWANIQKD